MNTYARWYRSQYRALITRYPSMLARLLALLEAIR